METTIIRVITTFKIQMLYFMLRYVQRKKQVMKFEWKTMDLEKNQAMSMQQEGQKIWWEILLLFSLSLFSNTHSRLIIAGRYPEQSLWELLLK